MCWCYWKIKNNKEIIAMDTDSIIFSNSLLNNRYIFKIDSKRIYDTKKDIFLNTKQITKKLNRLEYYKGICFD